MDTYFGFLRLLGWNRNWSRNFGEKKRMPSNKSHIQQEWSDKITKTRQKVPNTFYLAKQAIQNANNNFRMQWFRISNYRPSSNRSRTFLKKN